MKLKQKVQEIELLLNEVETMKKELKILFKTRSLGNKHYNIQYGICCHYPKEMYITIVKYNNMTKKWINIRLWEFNLLTGKEKFLIDINKLKVKHRNRLIKLSKSLVNRVTREV